MDPSELASEVLENDRETTCKLLRLPTEVIQRILFFLDVDSLLVLSRTSKGLRALATDPVVHIRRLRSATSLLEYALSRRITQADLLRRRPTPLIALGRRNPPPQHQPTPHPLPPPVMNADDSVNAPRYLNSPTSAAQLQAYISVSRLLIKHSLRRKLQKRSTLVTLVEKGFVDTELLGNGRRRIVPAHRDDDQKEEGSTHRERLHSLSCASSTEAGPRLTSAATPILKNEGTKCEIGPGPRLASSIVPALRQLKRAQRRDLLKRSMRASPTSLASDTLRLPDISIASNAAQNSNLAAIDAEDSSLVIPKGDACTTSYVNPWKTAHQVVCTESARHIWKDSDPRIVSLIVSLFCKAVKERPSRWITPARGEPWSNRA